MVEDESGDVNLIPLKVYEVGSRISSQFKQHLTPAPAEAVGSRISSQFKSFVSPEPCEAIEEVVVESLGPFTDSESASNKTTTPKVQRRLTTGRKQQIKISPIKAKQSSIPAKSHSSKSINKLIEDLVSDPEEYGGDEIENDPDYVPEEFSNEMEESETKDTTQEKQNKTEDDFELDEKLEKYRCKICERLLKTKKSVKKHIKIVCKPRKKVEMDLSESEMDMETNKFKCKVCGKTFKSLQTITAHKRDICNVAPRHNCFLCDYKCRNATVLRVHIGKTHGKWPQLKKDGTWTYL